jgi:transposase-like protein
VIGVAKPREQRPTRASQGELRRAELEANERLEKGLEKALRLDAEEAARETGAEVRKGQRKNVFFRGADLSVVVPILKGVDGKVSFPPLYEALTEDQHGVEAMQRAGVSTRQAELLVQELAGGEKVRGTSKSSVSRQGIEVSRRDLDILNSRQFYHEPIVQVSIDGTGIGVVGDKTTVMIAIGITADGRRLALGAWVAQHEKSAEILAGLRSLVERGISPDVLWTADQGSGIYAALKRLGATRFQICTTHYARNVAKELPDEMEDDVRRRMYASWSRRRADVALREFIDLRNELREKGHKAAARKINKRLFHTLTVIDLGLRGEARRALRSTNPLESINRSIKRALRDVTLWRKDEKGKKDAMILRWVARELLWLETDTWRRIADPGSLVDLMEVVLPGQHDPEAIRPALPPNLVVDRLTVPLDEEARLAAIAERWCAEQTGAVWAGPATALRDLGLRPGGEVRPADLVRAMRGEHVGSGETVREAQKISLEGPDSGAEFVDQPYPGALDLAWELRPPRRRGADGEKVPGLFDLHWKLCASPSLMREWNESGPERRAEIEQALVAAAGPALENVTSTTRKNESFLTTMVLTRPADGLIEQSSDLQVSGIVVALKRGRDAKLSTPASDKTISSENARAGEDAAKAAHDRDLHPEPAQAPPDAQVGAPDLPPPVPAAPAPQSVVIGAERWAIAKGPAMVELKPEELGAKAGRLDRARHDLGAVEAEVSAWCKANWKNAVQEVAARPLPEGPKRNAWFPLRSSQRMALGDERARRLLIDAELMRGRAEGDPEVRADLEAHGGGALAGLGGATERIKLVADALAAEQELARRRLLDSPGWETKTTTEKFKAYDARGDPALSPIPRNHRAMRGYLDLLTAHSAAIAADLRKRGIDDTGMRGLIGELGNPWSGLELRLAMSQSKFETARDFLLKNYLKTVRGLGGQIKDSHQLEEAMKNADRLYAVRGEDGVAVARANELWLELQEDEGRLDQALQDGRCLEKFLRKHPEVVLHDAAYGSVLEHQRAHESAPGVKVERAPAPAVEIDMTA